MFFLHGGPGAGASPNHRRFFDPKAYRIFLFDQRGAGRSLPYAETKCNTTNDLISDIELLRKEFGIKQWLVFGGSWGATLAIAYACQHRKNCLGLILRGVFLGRRSELDWFLYGVRVLHPTAWARFTEFLPDADRGKVLEAYHSRLNDKNPKISAAAARAWNTFETECSTVNNANLSVSQNISGSASLALARIEVHYFLNGMFLENDLLNLVPTIAELPCVIVQGRYDLVCPMGTAWELSQAWPGSRLIIIDDAGHSAMEPGIRQYLVAATETFKKTKNFKDFGSSP